MSFKDLKKRSTTQESLKKLQEELEKTVKDSGSSTDDRQWYPIRDKTGNGFAIIRFLPPVEGETVPWVCLFSHGFQRNKGVKGSPWYIENCPTTINRDCPVCDANRELWNTGLEGNKQICRNRKRKVNYYSNILVIKDPSTPENEGKNFIFRYGQTIKDKIDERMGNSKSNTPLIDDEGNELEAINPFDFWNGANFVLKISKKDGYANYDNSKFQSPKALSNDDKVLEKLWKKEYPLQNFIDEKQFKPLNGLEKRFAYVLGEDGPIVEDEIEDVETSTEPDESVLYDDSNTVDDEVENENIETSPDGEDDTIQFFKDLAEDEE